MLRKLFRNLKAPGKTGDPADIYTPHHRDHRRWCGKWNNPTPLFPLPYKDTYYTGSPDAITTLEAAKKFSNLIIGYHG